MIRVVLAEDQPLLRASLAALLNAEPDMRVVAQAADGAELVSLARQEKPDLVLTDLRMPVMGGIEATQRICQEPRLAATRVLVLTMFEEDEYIMGALHAGASGFLLKDSPPQSVVDAVRTVHAGTTLLSAGVLERVMTRGPVPAVAPDTLGQLTSRQKEVLALIARGRSNSEIEQELRISRGTCRSHITALLARLGARDRAQLVVTAYETGLVRPGEHLRR